MVGLHKYFDRQIKLTSRSTDYGESHYVGPIEGAQPDGTTWVNGFDHQGKAILDTFI